jgi:uncharacterized protein (TIGR03437 family)
MFRVVKCTALVALFTAVLSAQNVITTIAGVDPAFTGDGQPAISVGLGYINGVATDSAGNIYFTDPIEHLVLRVSPDGTLSVIAGNGIADYSGDGGPATSAAIANFDNPVEYVGPQTLLSLGGIAVDKQGNVYFADGVYLRRVTKDGIISTVAGGGPKVPGNGVPATQVALNIITGVALDSAGNLYFSEGNRVRKVTADGIINTYAGAGSCGSSGDNGAAIAATLCQPLGLAFDAQGNLYVADGDVITVKSRLRKITPNGIITTVAGGGTVFPVDGAAPLNLDLSYASGVAVDASGAIYVFAPFGVFLIKISGNNVTLVTSTVAKSFADNIPARNAYLVGARTYDNSGIAFDAAGNLYAADSRDGRLCKIDKQGLLTTVAGNGTYGFGGDGGPALGANLQGPSNMTQVPNGTIYFLDTLNARVRAISPTGIITSVLSTDNYPPLGVVEALYGLTSDPSGNLYVLLAHRLLELTPDGNIQVLLNQAGLVTDTGDGGLATQAGVVFAGGLTRDVAGNLYVSDQTAARIRKITTDGKIHTIAGTGSAGKSPDGAVAAISPITAPASLLADNLGGIYFEEAPVPFVPGQSVLRYITPDGHLKSIAGTGNGGFSGDGGPATRAGLFMQVRTGLAFDKRGNLLLSDGLNNRVRMINSSGIITTFAGNGNDDNAGDGGLATNASLLVPRGLLVDPNGNVFISDIAANRIREVLAAPPPISVSPTQISFSAKAGGARTPPQKLTMSSPVSGLDFTITKSAGADWLVIAAQAGDTPQLIGVRADPSNLAPGTYQATITVASPLATPAATTVAVTFQVAPGDNPQLSVDRTSLSFTFPSNPTGTLSQQVRVSNVGTGSLAFTARVQTNAGGNWLSVSPAGGSVTPQLPLHLVATANPAGLAAGTYTGTITISSSTTGATFPVQVALTISTLDQAMRLSHAALSFTAVSGGGIVPPASFAVSNIGRGNMSFKVSTRTLSGGQQWLSATPAAGAASAGATPPVVTVTVNQASLAPGFYFGLVRVDAAGAANTPQIATIALHVLPMTQDPGPVIQPSEIVFNAVQGEPSPGSKTLSVYNVSATPQTYVSGVIASDPKNKFNFIPANSTLALNKPTKVVVQPLTSNLATGVYDAELTLQFSDGNIRRVGVRTVVKAPAPGSTGTNSPDGGSSDQPSANCTPSQLVPAITTLGQSFGVPTGWPVAVEVAVQDDCGNTFDAGSVKASFSNGDPPLSLQSAQGGMWNTTWVSGNSTGPVTLTITANDPVRSLDGIREVTGGLGDPSPAPMLNAAVSGASFAPNTPLAPGSIISLFGQSLSNGTALASQIPLGFTLAGASVVMAGNSLPLFYSSSGQVNAFVSAGITPNTSHQILVQRDNTFSVPISVDVAQAEPAIFGDPFPGDPASQGAIVNAVTYAVAHPATPVSAGDVLAIFCTGLGAVDQTIPDGAPTPVSPLANTITFPTVTVGGKPAHVAFSGLAPGFTGLYQIDAVVPAGVTPGNQVPVIVTILGQTGPSTTIAVK